MSKKLRTKFRKLFRSTTAVALPVTFLLLFVSTLGIVAFTYYFAVERVNAQGQTLKVSTAKQDLLSLDDAIISTLWQPGSSSIVDISDNGGRLNIQPDANNLELSVMFESGGQETDTYFNSTIGQITYELPYLNNPDIGLYLKGDERTVTNQSGAAMTQVRMQNGVEYGEIFLGYRPKVMNAITGVDEENRATNDIRVYIVNLNASETLALYGKLPLKVSCQSTTITTLNYTLSYAIDTVSIISKTEKTTNSVSVPIMSTIEGSVIKIELVISYIKLERTAN